MKQVLLGKRVAVADVPAGAVGRKQVMVEVAYSFISTGTEIAGVKAAGGGLIGKITQHPQRIAQVLENVRVNGIKKTLILVQNRLDAQGTIGYSLCGRVLAVGKDIPDVAVGDWVACGGQGYASHAEVAVVPINLVAKIPAGCDRRSASGTTVASIAMQGVRRAGSQLGETVAVVGLGLLGQITLQLLAASGVKAVGFDPNPARVGEAQQLGHRCFAMCGQATIDQMMIETRGVGADATIITAATSAPGVCQTAMEMTRRKGRVVIVGAVPIQFDREPFYRREIDFLISCSYGPGRYDPAYEEQGNDYPLGYVRWTENRNMQSVLDLMASGGLKMEPLISAEYPIDQADQAFASLSADSPNRPLAVVLKYALEEAPIASKQQVSISMASPRPVQGKIKLGIVGVGQFCSSTHLPNIALLDSMFQVTSVCDAVGAKAQDVARRLGAAQACTDFQQLVANKDVDVALITTRHDLHAPMAIAALKAGKHVFVEKPMAMNAQELAELAQTIQASGRYYMVGFNRRFSPHMMQLKTLLKDRTSPLALTYRVMADYSPPDSWIYSSAGGGRVIGEACHMLDIFNYLVGEEVEMAELDVVCPPPGRAGPAGDSFVATALYQDGSHCSLMYSALGRKSKDNGKERIEAMWDNKTYLVDDFVRSLGTGCSVGSAGKKKSKGHLEELRALAMYLSGKGPAPISVEACLRATEMSFAVDACCRQSSSV
jgi:predicted dehydrogenase/threonine dehydrogenase-like Zn-dependent dehydrogenase